MARKRERKMLKRHLVKFRMGPEHNVYTWPAQSPYWAICRQTGTEIGVNIPEIGNSVVAKSSVIHLSYYNWWGLLSHPRLISPQNSTAAHNCWGIKALLSAHNPGFYFKGKNPIHCSSLMNDFFRLITIVNIVCCRDSTKPPPSIVRSNCTFSYIKTNWLWTHNWMKLRLAHIWGMSSKCQTICASTSYDLLTRVSKDKVYVIPYVKQRNPGFTLQVGTYCAQRYCSNACMGPS